MKIKNDENQVLEGAQVQEQKTVKKVATKKVATLEEKIEDWKAQFGRLYKNEIEGETIIWRTLRRSEYRELLRLNDIDNDDERLFIKQEATLKAVALYPENIEQLIEEKAGLATILSEEILSKSGFDVSQTVAL